MHQNDGSVKGVVDDVIFYRLGIAVLPILGIHRPVHQGSAHQAPNPGVGTPIRGPDQICSAPAAGFVQQFIGFLNLALHAAIRQAGQVGMVIAVIGHLMSLPVDPRHRLRIVPHIGPHHKEGHRNASSLQAVQKPVGIRSRAVVKGQRHQLLPGSRRGWRDGQHQAGHPHHSQDQGQNSFHEQHLFL